MHAPFGDSSIFIFVKRTTRLRVRIFLAARRVLDPHIAARINLFAPDPSLVRISAT
jgi:hypothetical protein